MNRLDTRTALINKLTSSGIKPTSEIAFENSEFNPDGLESYLSVYFVGDVSLPLGKSELACDQIDGLMQVSVFIQSNLPDYDTKHFELIDQILAEFSYGSKAVYNGGEVYISDSSVNTATVDSAWYRRDVSINYFTFNARL